MKIALQYNKRQAIKRGAAIVIYCYKSQVFAEMVTNAKNDCGKSAQEKKCLVLRMGHTPVSKHQLRSK